MTTKLRLSRRGQVLPLAAVSLILLALMTMLSFNITNVIHEKIRLQNYSDAQAFSISTGEARIYNYLAYSNRASAASFVTIASLHGFYAVANMAPQLLRAAAVAMGVEALAEIAVCIATWGTSCCPHIPKPIALAVQFAFSDANNAENKLRGWERPFNDAVNAYWELVNFNTIEQNLMLGLSIVQFAGGFGGALKGTAAQASGLSPAIGVLNGANFLCTLEGSKIDTCSARKSVTERSKMYTEIINASRPEFMHQVLMMGTDYLPMIGQRWSNLSYSLPAFFMGTHAIGDSSCSPQPGHQGRLACGDVPFCLFVGSAHDLPGVGGWAGSEIYSNNSGGGHSPRGAHSTTHNKFKGIPRCVSDKECFINFREGTRDNDWGQPSVFAYYSSDLTKRPKDQSTPWILGSDGKLSIDMAGKDNGQPGILEMKPSRTGAAMSRAMTYFHAPGSWPRPPNMFDPYWAAKLHPLTRMQVVQLLALSGGDKMSDLPAALLVEGGL